MWRRFRLEFPSLINVMSSWWRWHPRWGVRVVPKTILIFSAWQAVSACFVGTFIVGFWYRSMWIGSFVTLRGLVLFGRWPSIIDCSWKIPLVFLWGVVVNVVVFFSDVVCWFYFGVCFFCVKGMSIFPCSCSVGWVFHGIPHQRFPSQITTTFLPEERPGRCNATGGQLASLTLWH